MVRDLAEGGSINTQRGAGGGFRLARLPQAITLGEAVRALEERHALVECFRGDERQLRAPQRAAARRPVLAASREAFMRELDTTTLAGMRLARARHNTAASAA